MEQNVVFITKQNAKELGKPASYREIVFTSAALGDLDSKLTFLQVTDRLPAMEQKVVMLYLAGYTESEVAGYCGTYQRNVSRQIHKLNRQIPAFAFYYLRRQEEKTVVIR